MKFTIVSTWNIENNYTAVPYLVYEYAKFLADNGMRTELLIPTTNENPPKVQNWRMLRKRYLSIPKGIVERSVIRLPQWHLTILKDLPTDSVIYLPNSIYDSIINILTKSAGQRYIVGCHSMFLTSGSISHKALKRMRNGLVRVLLSLIGRELDNVYFHVINKEQGRYLTKAFGIKNSRIFYVPNMIEASKYRIKRNHSKKLKVLHVGGMIKDLPIVLEVINRLKVNGLLDKFEFYFIGRDIEHLKADYKNSDNIFILGMVSDKEKYKAMSEADVMIVPGTESFSVTMLEGLASGLYILTSKKTTTWKDMHNIGIKVCTVEKGAAEEYLEPLIGLARFKNIGKEFNPYRRKNRKLTIKQFGTGSVLPKILEMFVRIGESK